MVSFNEMLEESDDKFGIFADNIDIFRRFDRDGLVVVAALVETYGDLPVDIVPDRHLALASVALSPRFAGNELVQSQLFELLPFFYLSGDFCVSEVLSVVVLYHSVYILYLLSYLFFVG